MRMNNNRVPLILTTFALVLATAHVQAYAGNEGAHGAGHQTDEANPWFLGSEPIGYCVEVDPAFPIRRERVQSLIQDTFNQWKAAFIKYWIYQKALPGEFSDGKKRSVTVDILELQKCDDPEHQLQFKIGVGMADPTMKQYFEKNSTSTIGEAFRGTYDHITFRSGGVIWIAPENWVGAMQIGPVQSRNFPSWNREADFQAVLAHEIGHVLGFPHLSGTVMTPDIYLMVFFEQNAFTQPSVRANPLLTGKVESEGTRLNVLLDRTPYVHDGANSLDEDWLGILGELDPADPWKRTEYLFRQDPPNHQLFHLIVRVTTTKDRIYEHDFFMGPVVSYGGTLENTLSFFSPAYTGSAPNTSFGPHTEVLLDMSHVGRTFEARDQIGGRAWNLLLTFGEDLQLKLTPSDPNASGWIFRISY